MLRYDPPILFTSRIATEDLEIGGVPVAADQLVMLNLTAANHDPARFEDPARFDVTRRDVRHLSFGHGVHFCLGASLARLEAEVAFRTLLERYPVIEEVGESDWTTYTPLRGRQRLDLTCTVEVSVLISARTGADQDRNADRGRGRRGRRRGPGRRGSGAPSPRRSRRA